MADHKVVHFTGGKALTPGDCWVGIDQSLTGFGLALVTYSNTEWRYAASVYSSPNRGVDRLQDIAVFLRDALVKAESDGLHIQDIAMEATVRSSPSASVLGELSGIVKMTLLEHAPTPGRYPLQVPPSTLKKYLTNKGNATKKDILLSMERDGGVVMNNDNAADALGLAMFAAGAFWLPWQLPLIQSVDRESLRQLRG